MMRDGESRYEASSPLVAIVDEGGWFRISPGDRRVTYLHPQHFDYDESIEDVGMVMHRMNREVPVGLLVAVRVVPVRFADRETTALRASARVSLS